MTRPATRFVALPDGYRRVWTRETDPRWTAGSTKPRCSQHPCDAVPVAELDRYSTANGATGDQAWRRYGYCEGHLAEHRHRVSDGQVEVARILREAP